jgi:tRNA U55 pseudouridine synthase TruB
LSVDGALTLEEISWGQIKDWSLLIPHIPRIEIPEDMATAIRNGHQVTLKKVTQIPAVASLPRFSIFAYASEEHPETIGLLKVLGSGDLEVAINLGRYPGRK